MPVSMRLILSAVVVAVGFGLLGVPPANAEDGKYQFMKATESRVWRLDTESGEITVCTLDGEQLLCTTSANAAVPTKKSYAEIQAEKATAKKAVVARREKQQETDLKILDRIIAFVREMIAMAKDQASGN
jgi:hypothetical protein